ncbi:MAG: RNA methyltransferase, partial [Muribaculaceae bacterium]|nr:RNA methyltransferase [Muribaculaceae bacterium]
SKWTEAPQPAGVVVTNPPYGERISAPDMDALYETIGSKLKHVFTGYNAWIIGYRDEYFRKIGLAASEKIPLYNGSLECELREYVIFDGDKKSFMAAGGKLKEAKPEEKPREARRERGDKSDRRPFDRERRDGDRKFSDRKFADRKYGDRKFSDNRPDRFEPKDERPADSENPFAVRRNPHALKSIGSKKPSLPPQSGPLMRSRGWKKRDSDSNNENN